MRSRPTCEANDISRVIFNIDAHQHPAKCKVLPYLRTVNYDQPIDYRIYENLKRMRKAHMPRPERPADLFLEGEVAYSAPRDHRNRKNRDHFMHLLTPHRTSKVIKSITDKIIPECPLIPAHREETAREKDHRRRSHLTTNHIKPCLPKKIPTIQTNIHDSIRSETSRRTNVSKCLNSNLSIEMRSPPPDLQKPLLYLDKKELSNLKAESYIVMEYPSLQVITGSRFKNCAEIASLTKIMTFYTAFLIAQQKGIPIGEQTVVIDEEAGEMTGTSAQLIAGDVITVEQLMYGLMLPSGNDAAVALAKWAGGLITANPQETPPMNAFIARMNSNAKALEMKQSCFGNPHGLPNFRNSSNPYDLALLIAKCLAIPFFLKVVGTQKYSAWITNEGVRKEVLWDNTNKLLRRNGFLGVKTGVTVTAGPCLASCYQKCGKTFIVVLLRANKLSRRFKETRLLLGWTLRKYNADLFHAASKELLKNQPHLDSDNSQDEQQFHYQRMDAQEIAKRNKILVYEL